MTADSSNCGFICLRNGQVYFGGRIAMNEADYSNCDDKTMNEDNKRDLYILVWMPNLSVPYNFSYLPRSNFTDIL